MQNKRNDRQERFIRLLKEKGYYIVLSLCLVAAGVAGYVFVSNAARQNDALDQPTLSVPITVEEDSNSQKDAAIPPRAQEDSPVMGMTPEDDRTQTDTTAVRPVSGEVVQDHAMDRLAYNPTTKDWRVHNGVDLAAETGQTVCAARAGTVTAVYEDDYYGGTVVIRHEDGYTTHYANLELSETLSAGDTVAAGDPIGTVGGTALLELAQASHLHFEVYHNGTPVDPESFLP